jgi:ribosome biogenesis GTPase
VNPQENQARVIATYGREVVIEDAQGQLWPAFTRGTLPALIAADQVEWEPLEEDKAIVTSLHERSSLLAKQNRYGKTKLVASNVDIALVVIAPEPQPYFELIDRYGIALNNAGIEVAIVGNKADVTNSKHRQTYDEILALYRSLGWQTFAVSATEPETLQALQQSIHGKSTILLGQSGVGKSSITHALAGVEIRTQALSKATGLGQHTTTATAAYPLLSGSGYLIDSPGVRGFHPQISELSELEKGYPEILAEMEHCQFRDCSHVHEPSCGVLAALNAGKIHQNRLNSFYHIRDKLQL